MILWAFNCRENYSNINVCFNILLIKNCLTCTRQGGCNTTFYHFGKKIFLIIIDMLLW